MKNLALVTALIAVVHPVANAAESAVDRFHRIYRNISSVRCSFSLDGTITGNLVAVRGKGYRLDVADRLIVSDGASVWNITKSTKTVVIDAVRKNGEELNLERLFFSLLSVYRATPSPEGKGNLILLPPAPAVRIAGVERAVVVVDASMGVKEVTVDDGATTSTWKIRKLQLDAKPTAAEKFSFDAPKGWTVIDLR